MVEAADEALAALTVEERAVVEQFRKQMASPESETVSVVNESLGKLMDGTKIQFRPGPGKEPSPALPRGQRWAMRERRRLEAAEAARQRNQANRKSIFQQVEAAGKQLSGRNMPDTLRLIEMQSPHFRDFYILAEEEGQNRKGVLSALPPCTQKTREKYEAEKAVIEEVQSADAVEPLLPPQE
jgi:hypothetical protein